MDNTQLPNWLVQIIFFIAHIVVSIKTHTPYILKYAWVGAALLILISYLIKDFYGIRIDIHLNNSSISL